MLIFHSACKTFGVTISVAFQPFFFFFFVLQRINCKVTRNLIIRYKQSSFSLFIALSRSGKNSIYYSVMQCFRIDVNHINKVFKSFIFFQIADKLEKKKCEDRNHLLSYIYLLSTKLS